MSNLQSKTQTSEITNIKQKNCTSSCWTHICMKTNNWNIHILLLDRTQSIELTFNFIPNMFNLQYILLDAHIIGNYNFMLNNDI